MPGGGWQYDLVRTLVLALIGAALFSAAFIALSLLIHGSVKWW